MNVEAGDGLGDVLADQEAGHVAGRLELGPQRIEPARRHQERPDGVSRGDRPAYDLLALGQEEAVLGLDGAPELDVAQPHVVGQPRIVRILDRDDDGHAAMVAKRPGLWTSG